MTASKPKTAAQAAEDAQADVAGLLARVEALEAALAALSGPDGVLVTGSVAVVDEYGSPVVVLGSGSRPVEVLHRGKAGAWVEVDAGQASVHLRHLTASAVLGVRGGVSPGEKTNNGARIHLADGGAKAGLRAEHQQRYTGAGYEASGRSDLHLVGADVGGQPGATVAAAACAGWADVNLASSNDEDRATRLDVHVGHEHTGPGGFDPGRIEVERGVPEPPAWAR